jgi:hypothetical protein
MPGKSRGQHCMPTWVCYRLHGQADVATHNVCVILIILDLQHYLTTAAIALAGQDQIGIVLDYVFLLSPRSMQQSTWRRRWG